MLGLRWRLVLSHVIPVLLTTLVMGAALVLVLENQVVLVNHSTHLARQAAVLAEIATDSPELWLDPAEAGAFADRFGQNMNARLMLIAADGIVLTSSDPLEANSWGRPFVGPGLEAALDGQVFVETHYSRDLSANVAEVLQPVLGPQDTVVGVVRISQRLESIRERFQRLRILIGEILIACLAIGAATGLVLALTLEHPLARLKQSVEAMSLGEEVPPLQEVGPTEVRFLLRSFNSLEQRLRLMSETRRRLLANLVHEIGRALGALQSANRALAGGAVDEPELRRELFTGIEAEMQRMRRLLDDLTHSYDQALSAFELERRPVDLNSWLPQVLAPWQQAAQEKGITWRAGNLFGLPVLPVDSDRLGQALGNLLSNAIKFTPPGGVVGVSAGSEAAAVWIRIQDSGPGIFAEERARIFEPFYQGQTGEQSGHGMGLGLSIARDLIEAHGGYVEVSSDPGVGSHFRLWLPTSATGRLSAPSPN